MSKIRVGMIRCDVHGCWYGLLFQPADERLALEHFPQCHYYFYYRHELKFGMMPEFELTKVYDPFPPHVGITRAEDDSRSNAELLSDVFLGKPEVCETLEEASDDVDLVFIADCAEEGKDHLDLATPGLKKGVPTFVDKPFACTLADARAMVSLAGANSAPLLSASMLRVHPAIARFRSRFSEIEPVGEGFVKGVGFSGLGSVIHGLSLALGVFGDGVEWVDCMGRIPLEVLRMHYPSRDDRLPHGIDVVVLSGHMIGPNCGFQATAYGQRTDSITTPWLNDYNYPLSGQVIMNHCREMVRTRQPQIAYESMLEPLRVVEAGRLSQEQGKLVYLKDL